VAEKGIPSWPKVTIRLYDAHNGEVKIAGRSHPVVDHDPRQAALAIVAERAAQLGRPVKATAVEADGASWPLVIHPDGTVDAVATETRGGRGGGGGGGKSIWPIIAAAGLAVVLLAGTMVYLLVLKDQDPKVPKSTTSPTLPALPAPQIARDVFDARPVPNGWTNRADWALDVRENTTPAVSPDGKLVALITPDLKLAMLDASGKVLWQDKVTDSSSSPVFTTVDGDPVVAVVSDDYLAYWPRVGAGLPKLIKLDNGTKVQFFGSSPLVTSKAGTFVVSGESLRPIDANQIPRRATVLLAEGQQVLMSGYYGPWWLLEPDKKLVEVKPKAPPAALNDVDHVVLASAGRVLVLWKAKTTGHVIPAVHNTKTGAPVAVCQETTASNATNFTWAPDTEDKVAAWGECVISYGANKVYQVSGLDPQNTTGGKVYGKRNSVGTIVTPGQKPVPAASNMARPWGIAGNHAIVLHENVLYALAPVDG